MYAEMVAEEERINCAETITYIWEHFSQSGCFIERGKMKGKMTTGFCRLRFAFCVKQDLKLFGYILVLRL